VSEGELSVPTTKQTKEIVALAAVVVLYKWLERHHQHPAPTKRK
jgi:hypothetical protein